MDDTNRKQIIQRVKELKQQYKYTDIDIFNEDPTYSIATYIINTELNEVDKNIIYLYADAGNLRDLGKNIGCSHSSIRPEVNRIKEYIQGRINELRKYW